MGEETVDGNGGRDREDGQRQPLDVLKEVLQGNGREWFLVFECPGDIIVGNVDVGGDLLLRVGWLWAESGALCRRRLACLDDRRHGGGRQAEKEKEKEG